MSYREQDIQLLENLAAGAEHQLGEFRRQIARGDSDAEEARVNALSRCRELTLRLYSLVLDD